MTIVIDVWYIVLLDHEGTDDLALEYDHEPTEHEWHDAAQAVGYMYAGYFQAQSADEAVRIAQATFDGSACVP